MKVPKNIIYVFIILSGCITPLDISTSFHEQLVVEGMITDQPGPYEVKLSKTISVQNQLGEPTEVSGATVMIKDDQGNSETLIEKSSGSYYTKTFQGEVGKTYSISITTGDGNTYESIPEKMLPVGDFGNITYEFIQNEPPPPLIVSDQRDASGFHFEKGPGVSSTNGFKIYLESEVLPEQEGRVRWRWAGTFRIFAHPEQQEYVATAPGVVLIVPDAPPCSGYTVIFPRTIKAHLSNAVVNECTCCDCWVTEYNNTPILADQKFISNGKIMHNYIGFIVADRRTFYEKYYLEIEQLSMSLSVYNFWKAVQIQKGNSSNLFQIPPPKTGGNIISKSNSIPAIGFFSASASKKHSIFIPRSAVPYDVGLIDTIRSSCAEAYKYLYTRKNSSTKRPVFW